MSGTGKVLGATTTSGVVAATVLPNTGSNAVVAFAVAIGAGLLTWGVLHASANR